MKRPPNNHKYLWNELHIDERKRLMPHQIENQILHIWQCKQKAIKAHKAHMKELDQWISNLYAEI